MATRINVIPPVKCSAHSKRSKAQCGNWAIPGLPVCRFHGGGAHRNTAVRRLTLATLLESDRRPVWEVLLDATHVGDSLMRDARRQLADGEAPTAHHVENLVDAAKLAHHMSKTAIDTGAHTKAVDLLQRNVELEGRMVAEVLGRVLDALLAGLAGPALPLDRAQQLREWAFGAALAALTALDDPTRPTVSVPPPPLDGLALVLTDRPQLEPAAPTTAVTGSSSESSSDVRWRPAARQQPDRSAGPSAGRPAPASGTPAWTADEADAEPLDAELVDDDDGPADDVPADTERPAPVDHRQELAARLRAVRRTRVQLSELTGLSDSAVYRAKNGRVHEDELSTWERALADLDPDPAPPTEPRPDSIAHTWEVAGRDGHPLSGRLNRAVDRQRLRNPL